MRLVTIIGSHGYKAAYGGWDQLIINLAHSKTKNYKLKIINPRENKSKSPHTDIEIYHSSISGFGFFGLLLDYMSIFKNASKSTHFAVRCQRDASCIYCKANISMQNCM